MALFSSTQPSLRARVLPRFPAQVLAGNGITIAKSGGTYTFSAETLPLVGYAFADLPVSPSVGTMVYVTDSTTTTWGASITAGSGSSNVLAWWNGANWTVVGR